MRGITKAGLLLVIVSLMGCSYISQTEIFKEISEMEFFQKPEIIRIGFKSGVVRNLDLSQIQAATVALLPVRSSMGGGLGEEVVTKHFYENLARRFNHLRFISNEEASDMFTDRDIWEDYLEYLINYQQASVVNFDELKGLYQQLGTDYIISASSDYTLVPRYPTNFGVYIHVQVWDLNSAKMVWEGFGQGESLLEASEDTDRIRDKMVEQVSQRLVEELGTVPGAKGTVSE